MVSWLLPVIFFPLFFVAAHGWSYLLRENSLSTLWQRTVEWDVWWKLIRAFGLVEKVSTRTLRRFIPGNFRWDSSKYVLSSVATFHGLSFWQLTGIWSYFLRRFHREQHCPCVRQARGRPSNQANKQPAAKVVAKFLTAHPDVLIKEKNQSLSMWNFDPADASRCHSVALQPFYSGR